VGLTKEDIEAHERNSRSLCRQVLGAGDSSRDRHDKLTYTHPNSSHQEEVTATHLLNEIEAREGRSNIDAAILRSASPPIPVQRKEHTS
jgi:hypothetical protein